MHDRHDGSRRKGFATTSQYIWTNCIMNSTICVLIIPWQCPAMLAVLEHIERKQLPALLRLPLQLVALIIITVANAAAMACRTIRCAIGVPGSTIGGSARICEAMQNRPSSAHNALSASSPEASARVGVRASTCQLAGMQEFYLLARFVS